MSGYNRVWWAYRREGCCTQGPCWDDGRRRHLPVDLRSCSLGLPGTVSGAPLIKSDAGFPPCFYTKLPYDEKATISFLYGNTQINDLEFYMQLVENLTARVALWMKSDPQCKAA